MLLLDEFRTQISDIVNVIESNHNILSLELYNMQGKLLKIQKTNSKKEQVDLAYYPKGNYSVKIITEKGTKTLKIIKKIIS
ncbi:MAG: T9SS type A sorting domain-containing protein [Bergeyella sp.]